MLWSRVYVSSTDVNTFRIRGMFSFCSYFERLAAGHRFTPTSTYVIVLFIFGHFCSSLSSLFLAVCLFLCINVHVVSYTWTFHPRWWKVGGSFSVLQNISGASQQLLLSSWSRWGLVLNCKKEPPKPQGGSTELVQQNLAFQEAKRSQIDLKICYLCPF